MVSDGEDGCVEPHFMAVDRYSFVVTGGKPVCFSTLPFQLDENGKVEDYDSEKKVYLRGHVVKHKIFYRVHKKVVAWRVGPELDCEHPKILVLSSDGNWIKLLTPWKTYKDQIAQSILFTVQMLHFIMKQHRDKGSLSWGPFWDHLNEAFNKLDTKPAIEDLRKHYPLIQLLLDRNIASINLKANIGSRLTEHSAAPTVDNNSNQVVIDDEGPEETDLD